MSDMSLCVCERERESESERGEIEIQEGCEGQANASSQDSTKEQVCWSHNDETLSLERHSETHNKLFHL